MESSSQAKGNSSTLSLVDSSGGVLEDEIKSPLDDAEEEEEEDDDDVEDDDERIASACISALFKASRESLGVTDHARFLGSYLHTSSNRNTSLVG
jgi:hypothetical protein